MRAMSAYSQRLSSSPLAAHVSFQHCTKSSRMIIWMIRKMPDPTRAIQPGDQAVGRKVGGGRARAMGRGRRRDASMEA